MTTDTKDKEKRSTSRTPSGAAAKVDPPSAPVSGPVPPGLNDRREDGAPVLGHFVEITKGDHEGLYGVWVEAEGDNAVVRARDDNSNRVVVPIADLRAARPGRR